METEKIEAIAYRTIEEEFNFRDENGFSMEDFPAYIEGVITLTHNVSAEIREE